MSITSRSFIETARHTELVFGTDAVLTVLTILHCVAKKVGYFQNNGTSVRVPVPGPGKFCHGTSVATICSHLSSTKGGTQCHKLDCRWPNRDMCGCCYTVTVRIQLFMLLKKLANMC